VPFDLIAAGTSAAIEALEPADVEVVGVEAVVEELELLLPQPASATIASTGRPVAASSLLIEILLRG
jgi:orotate phosphoribosyltransferase